jgi:phosphoserine phosphatase
MKEIILINITGRDQKGAAIVTGVLAEHNVNVLDIGQAVIHDHVSLGILVEIPTEYQPSSVLKDLLFSTHDMGVSARFTPIEEANYERWVAEEDKQRRIITLLGRKLTAGQISKVAQAAADNGLNIDVITRLSGRVTLQEPNRILHASVQFTVSGFLGDEQKMRRQLVNIAQETGIDISFHVDDIYRRNRRLVVFDMDATLIQTEVIDKLAKRAGVGEEVAAITEAAMGGELDFRTSLLRRVSLLRGLDESILAELATQLPLSEGAERVIGTLKGLGYKTGILSGGFDYFGRHLQKRLGFDYMFANRLEIVDGKLTGRVLGEIVDGPKKAELLREIASRENLTLEQTIAVGDGANDLPMLGVAGLGVAFHAKPVVRQQAEQALSTVGLDGLLYLIGIRERDIRQG